MLIRSRRCLVAVVLVLGVALWLSVAAAGADSTGSARAVSTSLARAAGSAALGHAADTPPSDLELAEQRDCLASALVLPGILITPSSSRLTGKTSITFRTSEREVVDGFNNPATCQQFGARSSKARFVIMNVEGQYVSDTADKGGWLTLIHESNAAIDGDFTVHLRSPVEPPKLPNGHRVHCLPLLLFQSENTGHYGERTGSDSSIKEFYGTDMPGYPANYFYADHKHVCTAPQLRHALKQAEAQMRRRHRGL